MLMILNETFLECYIEVRNILLGQRRRTFMHPRIAQKWTIQRTIDSNFAPGAAALRTNIAAHSRAVPARTPLFTDFTSDTHSSDIPSMTVGVLLELPRL